MGIHGISSIPDFWLSLLCNSRENARRGRGEDRIGEERRGEERRGEERKD